jgi:hypothetical protein
MESKSQRGGPRFLFVPAKIVPNFGTRRASLVVTIIYKQLLEYKIIIHYVSVRSNDGTCSGSQ